MRVEVRTEPALANVAVHGAPRLVDGECGDWKAGLQSQLSTPATTAPT